jgi:hypothetical protein
MTEADSPAAPLDWAEVAVWLEGSRYYWIVTTRRDGRPHPRVVWGVWLAPRFYFATSPETITGRNIARSGYASVHPEGASEVVVIEGVAGRAPKDSVGDAAAQYERKYGWKMDVDDAGMPFYVLEVRTAVAWKAHDPRGSAMRWTFGDKESDKDRPRPG